MKPSGMYAPEADPKAEVDRWKQLHRQAMQRIEEVVEENERLRAAALRTRAAVLSELLHIARQTPTQSLTVQHLLALGAK